ncbi:MAG: 16S rRNA (uracil(1498)-N(3))-methyltransferase [Pseudomonadota bacterium]
MTRLYLRQPLASGSTVVLPDEAFRHLVQVLRMEAGEHLTVFNGEGGEYSATLATASRKGATLSIGMHDPASREALLHITIAQCVSKGDRMDYALQKSTELGAAHFATVLSAHGVVKMDGERWEKKVEHWRGVVVAAAEQSGRTKVPAVDVPTGFDRYLVAPHQGLKLILAPGGRSAVATLPKSTHITALIGPEGGFSSIELELADRHGWLRVGLGPRILRTETAPVALLAALLAHHGDLS